MSEPHILRAESPLRALIVEDEWPAREYLSELLLATNQIEIIAAVGTAEEARKALGPGGIDVEVAFVDIHLATSTGHDAGLTLVREFARTEGAPLFVLATALKQHAAEAFELDAVDYLLKPFSQERVNECLTRVARRRSRPSVPGPEKVVARSKQGLVFLKRDEVWAFEASERLTFVHYALGRFEIDLSLATLEATLGEGWARVHRNWVANLALVTRLERDEQGSVLELGAPGTADASTLRVPISRDKAQNVRDLLLRGTTGLRR